MKIGYTTGVFDLFHIGHLQIIKKAKTICDYLIVGVTTDELTINLKGEAPIIPYSERAEIIESIKYVDKVVPQNVIDEISDWEKLKFNIIIKGSDWKNTKKWNDLENKFKDLGVDVVFFPYTKTTSSSVIKKVLKKKINKSYK